MNESAAELHAASGHFTGGGLLAELPSPCKFMPYVELARCQPLAYTPLPAVFSGLNARLKNIDPGAKQSA
jgi:hypothetical protein